MIIALLAVLGVDPIVIAVLLAAVLGRYLFSAMTPISWKPPRGCTTSATRPAWP